MANGGKFGWFFGLLFGGLFGMLFAPRKGKDLRAKMKRDRSDGRLGVGPLQDDVKQIMSDVGTMAKEFYDSPAVNDMLVKGKKAVTDMAQNVKEDFSDVMKKINFEQEHPHEKAAPAKKPTKKKPSVRASKKKEI